MKKKSKLTNMLLSIGLFLNIFILLIWKSKLLDEILKKITIILIITQLFYLSYDIYISSYELILLDGFIRINNLLKIEEFIILIIALFIILTLFSIKLSSSLIMILLINIISMILLINSYDFLIFFLSWELFNLSLYLLITSQGSKSEKSISVGIKYFLLSALSTAFLGLGLILFYHEFGNLHYDNILLILNQSDSLTFNFYLAIHFIIFSFLFKLSSVPLHQWAPDLYDNIATKLTIWIAILPKILYLFILINIYNIIHFSSNLFILAGLLSLIFGAIGLTQQFKIKRFLTYSAITNVGYFLLSFNNINYLILNILIYSLTTLNIFAILIILSKIKDINYLIELKGLFNINPYLTFAFTFSLFSLAGLPPLAGFIGKLLLLEEYLNHYSIIIFLIIILSSTIAIYNYIKPILFINYHKNIIKYIHINEIEAFIITILTIFIIFLILQPLDILNIILKLN